MATVDNLRAQLAAAMEEKKKRDIMAQAEASTRPDVGGPGDLENLVSSLYAQNTPEPTKAKRAPSKPAAKKAGKSKPVASGVNSGGGEVDMSARQIAADRAKYEQRPLESAEQDYMVYKGSVDPAVTEQDARARELHALLRKRYEDARAAGKTRF